MSATSQLSQETLFNGVNTCKWEQDIEVVHQQPESDQIKFRGRNQWGTGGYTQATVNPSYGLGKEMKYNQSFAIDTDGTQVLSCEEDDGTAVESVLAGLSGFIT